MSWWSLQCELSAVFWLESRTAWFTPLSTSDDRCKSLLRLSQQRRRSERWAPSLPGCRSRRGVDVVLWPTLGRTNLLSELRDQERWGSVSLNSIDWGHLKTLCYSESYTQQHEPVSDALVASVMETIGNVLKVAAFSTDGGGLQRMMIFNVLERVLLQVGSSMKIHSNYCFGSRMVGLRPTATSISYSRTAETSFAWCSRKN